MTTAPNEPSVDKDLQNKASKPDELKEKRPVTKEKLRSIMEAASALTALGDEEDGEEGDEGTSNKQPQEDKEEGEGKSGKRYIPEHKKPDAALTFPEKVRIACVLILLEPCRNVHVYLDTMWKCHYGCHSHFFLSCVLFSKWKNDICTVDEHDA